MTQALAAQEAESVLQTWRHGRPSAATTGFPAPRRIGRDRQPWGPGGSLLLLGRVGPLSTPGRCGRSEL